MPYTIGLYSNSPGQPTGYGQQGLQLVSRLKRAGHNVAAFSNFGLEGHNSVLDVGTGKIPHYARGAEPYSNDVLPLHMADFKSKNPGKNVLITLYDVWVLTNKQLDQHNIASWVPIDHDPVPAKVADWLRKPNVTPIAMSKFGKQAIEKLGVPALYVPHAIETKIYKPTSVMPDGSDPVEYLGAKNKFVVGMNFANKGVYPNRKALGENLMAYAMFAQKHDDVLLYLHTEPFGVFGGINIMDLLDSLRIPKEKVMFVDPVAYKYGIDQRTLASIYSACDVGLTPSYGEGFGICTIEFQACGVPVITSNFAASAELAGPDSYLVNGQPLWDAPQKSWFNVPSVAEIAEALEAAYQRGKGEYPETVKFAQQYDADKVFTDMWRPVLDLICK